MNFKEKVILGVKKSTTVFATVFILGQATLPSVQVFAESSDPTDTTTEQVTEESKEAVTTESAQKEVESIVENPDSERAQEIITDPTLTDTEKTEKMYSVFSGMSKVSFGYTNSTGEKVTVQEEQNPLLRASLDMTEWTPYTFRVELNGYWAQGQMPVLKMDGEVVFCIEPGVAAQAGQGYTPSTLTAQQRQWFENIGNFGYPKEKSYEMYYTTQGYMWQKMGSSFSGSYAGFEAKKAQIDANIAHYYMKPSFDKQEITVKMGEPVTITDTNNVLSEYIKDVSTGGLKITRNGNKMTLEVTENTEDNAQVKLRKTMVDGVSIAFMQQGAQTIGKFAVSDPAQTVIPVKAIKEGDLQIGKQDAITGNMIPNTTYEGTIGDDHVKFTTGADGFAPLSKKYIHDTPYNLVEVSVPTGYTLDKTPITGKVVGGQTTKFVQKNAIQNAETSIEKTKEVYNAEESTKKGEPVYEMKPAPEIPFTQKSTTDITAPDGKTVIEKAGDYTDTKVTDTEGKATFKPMYNGIQNGYLITEDKTLENYRPMAPKEIKIAYGESSVSVVAHTEKFQNFLKKGKVVLNKKNSIDLANPLNLAGAKFHIKGEANTNTADVDLTTETTTESTIMELKDGFYFITEIQYPNGFTQPEGKTESMRVQVKDGETTVLDWENAPIKTPVEPVIPNKPEKPTPVTPIVKSIPTKTTTVLPQTGEKSTQWMEIFGVVAIVTVAGATIIYNRKNQEAK